MRRVDVTARVEAVGKCRYRDGQWDCEGAHGEEDRLHQDVLSAIADGTCEDPKACATEALRTRDYDFDRWYS